MRVPLLIIALVVSGVGVYWVNAQSTNAPQSNDEAAIRKTVDAYAATLKTGDLKGILAHWTPDADFTDEEGNEIKGHEALRKRFAEGIDELKAGKSEIKIKSVRFLTPDVATLDGFVEFTPQNGTVQSNKFSAVMTKKDGRWLIASARDLAEMSGEAGGRAVKALDWITGEWTAEDRGTTIKLTVKPELDGKFALMRYDIKGPKDSMSVLQLVGWDPIEGAIRSWAFDSRGGFGEGAWEREAAVWTSNNVGVLPSGQTGTSVNTIQVLNPNSFVWKSTAREVEGQPIPDHEIKFTRVVTKP